MVTQNQNLTINYNGVRQDPRLVDSCFSGQVSLKRMTSLEIRLDPRLVDLALLEFFGNFNINYHPGQYQYQTMEVK